MNSDWDDLLDDQGFACSNDDDQYVGDYCRQENKMSNFPETTSKKSNSTVDELLRELELDDTKHGGTEEKSSGFHKKKSSTKYVPPSAINFDDDDEEEEEASSGFRLSASSNISSSSSSSSSGAVLGGESCQVANQGSVARKIASANLRCLHCDFQVNRWSGMAWSDEADYLFFRNSAPDRHKMASMLKKKAGYAAYACQCSWVSVNKCISIRFGDRVNGKALKWSTS